MSNTAPVNAAQLIEPLAAWLEQKIPGASGLVVQEAVEPSQGFANTTICFRATWREGGAERERQLVARVQRASDTICPLQADVFHQWRVMEAVAAHSDVAVPRLYLAEPDPSILGAPFYLMDRIDGRVPPDFPSYHDKGWFVDLTPEQRERTWWNGIKEMARLHQISWRSYAFMSAGLQSAPAAGHYLQQFVGKWYEWAAQGEAYPLIETAHRRLLADQPPTADAGLVWNDARMGNTMFAKDHTVAALLDFDVALLGPAEIDLAWWLYMEDLFSTEFGSGRIEGIPDRQTAIEGFERIYGRPMVNFEYYEALAALKHAVISLQNVGNAKIRAAITNTGLMYASERLARYLDR